MKKAIIISVVFIISLFIYLSFMQPVIVESYRGFTEYHQLSNGKWQCDDEIYPYKHEVYDQENGSTYVILSHNADANYQLTDINAAIFSSVVPLQLDDGDGIVVEIEYEKAP